MDVINVQSVCTLLILCIFNNCAPLSSPGDENNADYWNNQASAELRRAKQTQPNIAVAKNTILFLGDGMGVSTVTAARILKGQQNNRTGEEGLLSFETFPHVALSKTYNVDAQTPDSAGTATAFVSGVKTDWGVLGVDASVIRGDCSSMTDGNKLTTMLHWALDAGKSVGIVTTARITHATPASLYANTPDRNWEGDADMTHVSGGCVDIAKQLVDNNININVLLGGGRRAFLRNTDVDPEIGNNTEEGRLDNRNLVEDWQRKHQEMDNRYSYVWNQTGFDEVDPDNIDYLLGLFSSSHMEYEVDRQDDVGKEPSLIEMTEKAIRILSKNQNGFYLLVEGGRIDHGHHASQAVRALTETVVFADAVGKAVTMTKQSDTLIVATADHSHVFTIGGYPSRGNPIFGLTVEEETIKMADDNKPFTTLMYANGPGSFVSTNETLRPDLGTMSTDDPNFRQQSAVPLGSETHGGEDVTIYARGPMAHLFHGVHEQHYIAHVMAYASCVGRYSDPDMCAANDVELFTSNSVTMFTSTIPLLVPFVTLVTRASLV